MTAREIVQRIARLEGYDNDARAERIIQQAIDEAVAQERERCALKCDAQAEEWNEAAKHATYLGPNHISCLARAEEADDLAKAIREGSRWLIEDPPVEEQLPD